MHDTVVIVIVIVIVVIVIVLYKDTTYETKTIVIVS